MDFGCPSVAISKAEFYADAVQSFDPAILVFTIDEGGEQAVHDVLADISGLQRSIGFRVPAGGLAAVVGIGVVPHTVLSVTASAAGTLIGGAR